MEIRYALYIDGIRHKIFKAHDDANSYAYEYEIEEVKNRDDIPDGGWAHKYEIKKIEAPSAKELAEHLIRDDMSRSDEGVNVIRDGATAVAGWMKCAGEAGDMDLIEMAEAIGEDALAKAWDEVIEEMGL